MVEQVIRIGKRAERQKESLEEGGICKTYQLPSHESQLMLTSDSMRGQSHN